MCIIHCISWIQSMCVHLPKAPPSPTALPTPGFMLPLSFPGGAHGKEPAYQCRRHTRHRFDSWVRKIHWRRAWQPALVLLPGESHGQRILAGHRVSKNWTWLKQLSMHAEQGTLLCSFAHLSIWHLLGF